VQGGAFADVQLNLPSFVSSQIERARPIAGQGLRPHNYRRFRDARLVMLSAGVVIEPVKTADFALEHVPVETDYVPCAGKVIHIKRI